MTASWGERVFKVENVFHTSICSCWVWIQGGRKPVAKAHQQKPGREKPKASISYYQLRLLPASPFFLQIKEMQFFQSDLTELLLGPCAINRHLRTLKHHRCCYWAGSSYRPELGWHTPDIPLAIPTLKWGARAPNLWKFYVHQNCSKTVYHISQKYELILERQKNRPTRQQVSILERTTVRQKCQF